jgi:hypothetical protein
MGWEAPGIRTQAPGKRLKRALRGADKSIVDTILHDHSLLGDGDDELLDMVQTTFDRARRVLGPGDARRYIRMREDDLYEHLETIGLGDRVPRVRAVYAAFWRLHAGV